MSKELKELRVDYCTEQNTEQYSIVYDRRTTDAPLIAVLLFLPLVLFLSSVTRSSLASGLSSQLRLGHPACPTVRCGLPPAVPDLMMITVVVADGSTTVRRDTEQCNCRLLFLIILMSLFFGYVLSHSVPHSGQRFREQFDAQKEPACGTDPWSCDLARAEFLLRFGRSCPNDSSIEPVEHRDLQSSSRTTPSSQCLVLSNSSAKTLCHQEPNRRRLLSRRLTLTFCHKYSLNILTRRTDWLSQEDPLVCQSILEPEIRSLMHRDLTASTLFCEFDVLLSRYNCHTNYSVVWNCSQCRVCLSFQFLSRLCVFFAVADGTRDRKKTNVAQLIPVSAYRFTSSFSWTPYTHTHRKLIRIGCAPQLFDSMWTEESGNPVAQSVNEWNSDVLISIPITRISTQVNLLSYASVRFYFPPNT